MCGQTHPTHIFPLPHSYSYANSFICLQESESGHNEADFLISQIIYNGNFLAAAQMVSLSKSAQLFYQANTPNCLFSGPDARKLYDYPPSKTKMSSHMLAAQKSCSLQLFSE